MAKSVPTMHPSGSREVIVSFTTNNPDNGDWTGRATNCAWKTNHLPRWNWEFEFDHDDWKRGIKITVNDDRLTLRIHDITFPFKRAIPWFGNWCWEGFVMERPAAIRLLKAMRASGKWHCTGAPLRASNWFKGQTNG